MTNQQPHTQSCQCGKVTLQASGPPIFTAACYCNSCRQAGTHFQQLPAAPPVLNATGGTDYLLYRKDRLQCLSGQEHLAEHRLKPESPTRRVVATCCNSALFLDFTKGHWLSLNRNRFPADAPPIEMRMMTQDRREGAPLPDDMPNHPRFPGKAMFKLLLSWAAMGFRKPTISLGAARKLQ